MMQAPSCRRSCCWSWRCWCCWSTPSGTAGRGTWLGWFTAIGLVAILVAGMVFSRPHADQRLIFGGMLRDDWLAFTFRMLFLFSAAITALLSIGVKGVRQTGRVLRAADRRHARACA